MIPVLSLDGTKAAVICGHEHIYMLHMELGALIILKRLEHPHPLQQKIFLMPKGIHLSGASLRLN